MAEQRARKFMQLQKVGVAWRKLSALDENGSAQPLFVDGDKNPKMVRTEVLTKRLAALLEKHTKKKFFPKRKEGKVFIDYAPVARLQITAADAFIVEWNLSKVAELGLDKAAITEELRAAGPGEADIQWGVTSVTATQWC